MLTDYDKDVRIIIEGFRARNKVFVPTWLMVKQHNITGLKYFCKTVRNNPSTYKGSGKKWQLHLKKHGADITTVWHRLFETLEELVEFAVTFSVENNIVESNEWANLKIETGIDGGVDKGFRLGHDVTDQSRTLMSKAKKGKSYEALMGHQAAQIRRKECSDRTSGAKNANALSWSVTDLSGKTHLVVGLRAWCAEHSYNYYDVYHSRRGWCAVKQGKGKGGSTGKRGALMLSESDRDAKRVAMANTMAKTFEVTTPEGETFIITNRRKWCRDNNVEHKLLERQLRGWKCTKIR